MLVILCAFAMTSMAQLESITPSAGLTLVKSTTTNYTYPVGKYPFMFSLQAYSVGSVDDTTSVTLWSANNTGAWELISTNTLVPSDTSDLITDTLYTKYIRVRVVAGNNDSTGVVHLKLFH